LILRWRSFSLIIISPDGLPWNISRVLASMGVNSYECKFLNAE